jgi:hypothetical protein
MTRGPLERFGPFLVGAFYIVYVASFAWSVAVPDTARDAFIAHGIRHGELLPLEGPVLGVPSAIHFGPLWYYLVSLPLWVSDSWIAFVLFQGMFCGLKFPLAWHCGRRIGGAAFGLAWAAVLALPGWATMEPVIPFNASAAEAAVLLAVAAWLRARDHPGAMGAMFLLGLTSGIALHAHPTTAPIALLGAEAIYRAWRSHRRIAAGVAAYVAGCTVLFLPYVLSQALNGWPDLSSAQGYVATRLAPSNLLLAPQLLFAHLYGGARVIALDLARWPPLAASTLGWITSGIAAIAVGGAFRAERSRRRVFAVFAIATLALLPWLLMLRPNTPFYFMNVLAVTAAGCIAAGWVAAFAPRPRMHGEVLLGCAALALQALVAIGVAKNAEEGGHGTSGQVLDVKDFRAANTAPDIWFPALDRADLGRVMCMHRPVALHGALAFVEDRSVGTDAIFSCGDDLQVSLGGATGLTHLVALAIPEWRELGMNPPCRAGSLGIVATPGPVGAGVAERIAYGERYFPRDVTRAADSGKQESLVTRGPGILIVSNFLYGYERLSAVTVTANGAAIAPAFEHAVSRAYVAPAHSERIEWRIGYTASAPPTIDIVFVPQSALVSSGGC